MSIASRSGLAALIGDVQSGDPDFQCLLVYDVSRWGRFQDVDESAYYEFICRMAGVQVHYCADEFENDGSLALNVALSRPTTWPSLTGTESQRTGANGWSS